MKKKTKSKIDKKRQNLPLHHIDTCIILEVLFEGDDYESCKNYLNRVGYNYRGTLSIPVLGEIFMGLISKLENETDKENAFRIANMLIDKRKMDFSSPQFKTYSIIDKIKSSESRVEPMDALNLAAAISDGANVFVTFDSTFLGNKKIETEFKIKIKHPNDV